MKDDQKQELLRRLDPVVKQFAKDYGLNEEFVEICAEYYWKERQNTIRQSWRDFLSANDSGPFAGR